MLTTRHAGLSGSKYIQRGLCASVGIALVRLAPLAAQAESARYQLDPHHSFVNIEVRHFSTSTVRARFDKVEGYVDMDSQEGKANTKISIDTASISSGIADFDHHLKSGDFLDVQAFPQATFTSSDFVFTDDKITTVNGMLTLLGKTLPVTLRASNFNCYDSPMLKAPVCGGDFEATINRSQWGMNWGIDLGIPDQVRLLVQVEAIKQ